ARALSVANAVKVGDVEVSRRVEDHGPGIAGAVNDRERWVLCPRRIFVDFTFMAPVSAGAVSDEKVTVRINSKCPGILDVLRYDANRRFTAGQKLCHRGFRLTKLPTVGDV